MLLLYLVIYIASIGGILFFLHKSSKKEEKTHQNLLIETKKFAKQNNLTFEQNYNEEESLTGIYKNTQISIYDEFSDNGRHKFFHTVISTYLSQTTSFQNLNIRPKKRFSKTSSETISSGDEELDKLFSFQGMPEHTIQQIFARPEVKSAFLNLHQISPKTTLENGIFSTKLKNHLSQNFPHIPDHLDAQIQCALALDQPAPQMTHQNPNTLENLPASHYKNTQEIAKTHPY